MGKNKNKQPNPLTNPNIGAREGMKMIRNIAFGKFNIYSEGQVFRNKDFVYAIIGEVDKRLTEVGIHIAAIQYAYAGSNDSKVLSVLHRDKKTYDAFMLIRRTMESIYNTGDTGYLWVLASKLPQYKYNI